MVLPDFDLNGCIPEEWRGVPHFLSLGVGVQSSTLAYMASRGMIRPKPVVGIFSDTREEPRKVYEYLDYLRSVLQIPIIVVSKGALGADSLRVRTSKTSGNTYLSPSLPVFTRTNIPPEKVAENLARAARRIKREGLTGAEANALIAKTSKTVNNGMMPRQCTRDYKIALVQRATKHIMRAMGYKRAVQWIGISTDEASRMKPSQDPKILSVWPLIEAGFSRDNCIEWCALCGYPKPPRSACKQCPYHSDAEWLRLKTEEPEDFADAVQYERDLNAALAQVSSIEADGVFLHDSRIPLDQVVFEPERKRGNQFNNECEGMCGV
jgi:hypothetical protein